MRISISDLYENYSIPPQLREHMLTASAIAKLLCDNWTGPFIHPTHIVSTMLIHDMGNIAKMDLSSFSAEQNPSSLKRSFISKYGADDHIATLNVAWELGLPSRILWLVVNKIFVNNEMIAASDDFDLKICAYSDQSAGPNGIVSLEERFNELRARYGDKPGASINHPRSQYLVKAAFEIERQLLKYTSFGPAEAVSEAITRTISELATYVLSTEPGIRINESSEQ